jgi:hypothetical protein
MLIQFIGKQDGKIAFYNAGIESVVISVCSKGDLRSGYRFLVPQIVTSYS